MLKSLGDQVEIDTKDECYYNSPEIEKPRKLISQKYDIWSLGLRIIFDFQNWPITNDVFTFQGWVFYFMLEKREIKNVLVLDKKVISDMSLFRDFNWLFER